MVFDDCDIEQAVKGAVYSIQWNSGQICIANSRIYVHDKIVERFVERFNKEFGSVRIGDALDKDVIHGPQADAIQFENVMRYIQQGKDAGAKVVLGCERAGSKGYHVQPTVFLQVPESSPFMKEEIFGPVVAIQTFSDEAEVLRQANDSEYGLYASVFTKNIDRALRFAKALEAGTVGVKCTSPHLAYDLPFGGYKGSGSDRENGPTGIEHYYETKTVVIKTE